MRSTAKQCDAYIATVVPPLTGEAPVVITTPTMKAANETTVPSTGPEAAMSKYCLRFFGKDSMGVIAPNTPSCV